MPLLISLPVCSEAKSRSVKKSGQRAHLGIDLDVLAQDVAETDHETAFGLRCGAFMIIAQQKRLWSSSSSRPG